MHAESVSQIHSLAADRPTEGTPCGNRSGMLDCANNDLEFMKTIITGDETWVYGYDPESKIGAIIKYNKTEINFTLKKGQIP